MRFLLFLALACSPVAGADAPDAFFPLMAWNSAPPDATTLKTMRECGLTVAGFVAARDLDLCEAAGMKAIVSDPRASDYDWTNVNAEQAARNISALVSETARHPAVFGYYLRDEPSADLFPGLATVARLLREQAPGKWPYINLFPNYASPQQLGSSNYEAHLEQFIATCKPTLLSYDHYALMDDGSLRQGYWQNLEQMRAAAIRHDLTFWNIVLAVAHFHYREPSAADLRFQVYTTLAYGGRGIAYFTYFAPTVGNYRGAAVDQFGHLTPTWHSLQSVNLQVAKLAPTLLSLHSDQTYHLGSVPDGTHGPGPASLILGPANAPFVVGDFTHTSGTRYALVVNKDFTKSQRCAPEFTNRPRRVEMVSPYSGQLTEFAREQQWLAPGQGVLLKLSN